jgi:hypothetical protein
MRGRLMVSEPGFWTKLRNEGAYHGAVLADELGFTPDAAGPSFRWKCPKVDLPPPLARR